MNRITLPAVKDLGAWAGELWKRGYIRWTFVSSVLFGLLTHMYILTNRLVTHDEVLAMFGSDYGTLSGRWLLPLMLRLDGPFSASWLIGLLGILCLAASACLSVSLLGIRRPLGCILTAAVMTAFPTVGSTFIFMFSADAYFFALLLAAFGAWAAVRGGWPGSILGAAAITLSMGIYQSYFPVAAVLMVGALLMETLDAKRSFAQLFLKGLRLVVTLAAAMAVYLLIVRLTTMNEGLTGYQGMNEMGQLPLEELPLRLGNCYARYAGFFVLNDTGAHFDFLPWVFIPAAAGALVLECTLLVRRRPGPMRTVLAVVLTVLYPLAGNLIYIMAPNAEIHELMIYGLCYTLLLPLAMAENARPTLEEGGWRRLHGAASWLACLALALAAWSYAVTANNAYLKIDLSMRECEAYSNRMLEQIEACEGYQQGMDVLLVGHDWWDERLYPIPELEDVQMSGALNLAGFRSSYTYDYYLRYFLACTGEIELGDSLRARGFEERKDVLEMPLYPQKGSIKVIDGQVVVRLS